MTPAVLRSVTKYGHGAAAGRNARVRALARTQCMKHHALMEKIPITPDQLTCVLT